MDNKTHRVKMTTQQIYQYLSQRNFNLSTDKVLKQPQQNIDIIWNILVFLSGSIKDTKYEQIQPMIFQLLSSQQHRNSKKRISEHIMISGVLKKIAGSREDFPIKQIIKPDKEFYLQKISILIQVNKQADRLLKEFEEIRTKNRYLKQKVQEIRRRYEIKAEQIEELKIVKKNQKSLYEQKIQTIASLTGELNYKKKEKMDLSQSHSQLQIELKKKSNIAKDIEYQMDDLRVKLKQKERQVLYNAPKLKKDRNNAVSDYQNIMKRNEQFEKLKKVKSRLLKDLLKPSTNLKQRSKTFKIQERFGQVEDLKQQIKQLTIFIAHEEESKKQKIEKKRELLKSMQNGQKRKKQANENFIEKDSGLLALDSTQKILHEEIRRVQNIGKYISQSNNQSIQQEKSLYDKILHKREKIKQAIFELNYRLKNIQIQSKAIIQQSFTDFN